MSADDRRAKPKRVRRVCDWCKASGFKFQRKEHCPHTKKGFVHAD